MKIEHVKKLLGASETKKQLERVELAALRTAQGSLQDKAEALDARARNSRITTDAALTGADVVNYGRNIDRLYASADGQRARAADYDAPIAKQEDAVRAALRRELAWKALFSAAEARAREEFEKKEEQLREETSLRASKSGKRSRWKEPNPERIPERRG